jgi:hypothetical protein
MKNKIYLIITLKKYSAQAYDGCLPLVTAIVKNSWIYTCSYAFIVPFLTNTRSTEAVLTEVSHMHCFHTVVTLLLPLIFITFLNLLLLTPYHQIHILV